MKAHMICHTHWDREWYFTREEFRTKLVRLIDGLLELIDQVPQYVSFMLDGQTIAIEDYLEIKPYQRERLYRALESGKIICGPWYILPDELLVSGESHIRNYLIGGGVLPEGSRKMKTAYLPDSFGHPCQMPQIVEGLGMDTMVFWRGTANFVKKTEFYWESPAKGCKTLCVHMPCGYGNCANLSGTEEEIFARVEEMVKTLGAVSTTDVVLLMNGSDHITGQKDIVEVVKAINGRARDFTVELSTLERFIGELKEKLPELETYTGEFRYGERSMLLGGTLSTRMYLKQKNDQVQRSMEQYLEPLWALEALLGGREDTRGWRTYLWKKILENQPHDSICGCSIDQVHREMETRFACVDQLQTMLTGDAMGRIAGGMEAETDNSGAALLLFEPSQDSQPSYVEAEIQLDRMLVQEVIFAKSIISDYEPEITHPGFPRAIRITDEQGREIPHVILSMEKGYPTRYQDHTAPEVYKANVIKVGMLLPAFAYGLHTLRVERLDADEHNAERQAAGGQAVENGPDSNETVYVPETKGPKAHAAAIENAYYTLTFQDGAFTVVDKKTGICHKGVNRFVDKGDAGDEYTYSWPLHDRTYTLSPDSVQVEAERVGDLRQSLKVTGELLLPEALTEDRKERSEILVPCPVTVMASLTRGVDRIDFTTCIDNRAKDHRLQVQFPSGIRTAVSQAEDIFHITERNIEVEVPETWAEYPQSTHPCHGFLNLEDESGGVSLIAQGLTEFEGEQGETETCLNLTLLRCVGWLSRTDLLTREGNGGWTIETPEGQCLGSHRFDYSLSYHKGSYRHCSVYALLNKALRPALLWQEEDGRNLAVRENPLDFLSDLPGDIRVSVVKPAEDGDDIILRLFHIGGEDRRFELRLPERITSVEAVNLAEEAAGMETVESAEGMLTFMDHRMALTVRASQIVTLRLRTE